MSITVDGDPSDWDTEKALLRDSSGDAEVAGEQGSDIMEVYVARDDSRLYVLLRFDEGVPSDRTRTLVFFMPGQDWVDGEPFIQVEGSTECAVWGGEGIVKQADGEVAASGTTMELSVPLSAMNLSGIEYVSVATELKIGQLIDMAGEDAAPLRI